LYIVDKLERLNEDDKFRTDYNVELVRRKEINSARLDGFDDGYDAGAKAEKIEIAKNFLKDGISIEVVSRNTGLSIEELEELNN
ncbi:MAG TPA: ATPase, partial [Candidatus Onthousia faecipullorum]|nr:ATPase [Candidatus Onthousia faecipullorum]